MKSIDGETLCAEETGQFDPDLLQTATVSFTLFEENFGNFRIRFELRFSELLNFQIHHFLD